MDIIKIRKDFPFLERMIKGKPILYLDSAATSQKPHQVIDAIVDFYKNHNANIHRGSYRLSQEASQMFEDAHKKTAKFIGAKNMEEIIFTKNTTESINIVAHSLDWKSGDEVIVTELEHHSNIVPWMMLAEKGVKLKFAKITDGKIDMDNLKSLITNKTKLISVAHVSNFLGTINDVKNISKIAHQHGALCLVDGAQSAPHMDINVKDIGCDFFAFSSHKMLGPTGLGVLYGKKELLEKMKPFMGGGDMITKVEYSGFTPNVLPWKFEAGTQNIADAVGFSSALDYLSKIGMKNVRKHDEKLLKISIDGLKTINGIEMYGPEIKDRSGLISFNVKGIHHNDVGIIMDSMNNICVRSGYHCVEPMHRKLGLKGSVRASFYVYNTEDEVELFLKTIKEIAKSLR